MTEITFACVCLAILFGWIVTAYISGERHNEEREAWGKERQQLLDRIQAPTFTEYKQAEVKVIRAQNGEKPPQPLDPL